MKLFTNQVKYHKDEEKEILKAYKEQEDSMYHTYHKYGMIIAIFIYMAFITIDIMNLRVYRQSIIFSRIFVFLPVSIFFVFLHDKFKNNRLKLYTVLSFISFTWLNMTYVAIFASKEGNASYQLGMILTLTGVQILMNLKCRIVLEISAVLIVFMNIAHFYFNSAIDIVGLNAVFLMLTVMTSYRNYASNIIKRNNFFMQYKLNNDYDVVGANNQHLEEMLNYKDQELKYMDIHDHGSNAFNRQYFNHYIKSISLKNSLPLTLVVYDIDGMKIINEAFGMEVGNEYIKHAGDVLIKAANSRQTVFRCGGDEFFVLMEKCNGQDMEEYSLRVEEEILKLGDDKKALSFSYGSETANTAPVNFEELIVGAEEKLAASKKVHGVKHRKELVDRIIELLQSTTHEDLEHTKRISRIAKEVGTQMGLTAHEYKKIALLSKIHDVGIITLPTGIMNHNKELSDQQWTLVKNHPEIGHRIAKASIKYKGVAEEVLSHHENVDGSGYPRGLRGDEIPKLARLLRVIDSYEVMTSNGLHGKRMSPQEALDELKLMSNTRYDPSIVGYLEKVII